MRVAVRAVAVEVRTRMRCGRVAEVLLMVAGVSRAVVAFALAGAGGFQLLPHWRKHTARASASARASAT